MELLMKTMVYRRVAVDGIEIFCREAGRPDAPAILLLHGTLTAGHKFAT
jgi:hypothetical protein